MDESPKSLRTLLKVHTPAQAHPCDGAATPSPRKRLRLILQLELCSRNCQNPRQPMAQPTQASSDHPPWCGPHSVCLCLTLALCRFGDEPYQDSIFNIFAGFGKEGKWAKNIKSRRWIMVCRRRWDRDHQKRSSSSVSITVTAIHANEVLKHSATDYNTLQHRTKFWSHRSTSTQPPIILPLRLSHEGFKIFWKPRKVKVTFSATKKSSLALSHEWWWLLLLLLKVV